tara:strand:- start:893 stop:1984 length:1092 start_codon:yes stop_codon:yes gene_type:complete
MTGEKTIYMQLPIIPDYRMGVFLPLRERWGECFEVFAGEFDFGGSPVSTSEAWKHFHKIENHYLCGGRLLWQAGATKQVINADLLILNGNMRFLSNWMIQVIRKLLGRRTLLWGHAEGKVNRVPYLRSLYLSLSDGFIAYTKAQREMLLKRYPGMEVWVAPNSCVAASDCVPALADVDEVRTVLYVGRLVEEKKVKLLLEGYIHAREHKLIPEAVKLVFVGSGEQGALLEQQAAASGYGADIDFAGHVSEVGKLREFYRQALCSVSPGYVGLSATQSFSFGIPMLIARNEFHSPEIEACREGFNAVFFESDSPRHLAECLDEMYVSRQQWCGRRPEISDWTKECYSFEAMCATFIDVAEGVKK